jgi:hypothetical protein
VAAVWADDIWAVGDHAYSGDVAVQPLIEHWNGTGWSIVPGPDLGSADNGLYGVAAVSTSNIWAVGEHWGSAGGCVKTLVEHWNGTGWSRVPSPSPGSIFSGLFGVAALTANNVWAVGWDQSIFSSGAESKQTLVEHWDGTTWTAVPSPNPSPALSKLFGVTAVTAHNAWAVGEYTYSATVPAQTLIEHWNGTNWSTVPSPSPGQYANTLSSVAAVSADDIWAVGSSEGASGTSRTLATLVLNYSGTGR